MSHRAPRDWAELVITLAEAGQQDWTAIEFGDERISIGELADAMCRAAGALRGGRGTVAVSTSNPIDHTVGVLGAVAAGRTAMLVDAKVPDALLAEIAAAGFVTTSVGRRLDGVELVGQRALAGAAPVDPAPVDPRQIGSIFLTSGSTGVPKMVQRSRSADLHAAMCLRLANFPIDPGDRHWMSVPFASAAFLTLLMGAVFTRATVVIAPFRATGVNRFLEEKRISSTYLVPTMLRLAAAEEGLDGAGWRGLRGLMVGGERLDRRTRESLPEDLVKRAFLAYGMTEIPRPTEATPADLDARPGTVGRAIPMRQLRIVTVGTETDVAIGEEGEVLVTGPDLYEGYLGMGPAGKWHHTGDLGRLDDDGFLYITGRASSVVQVGGNRVSTEEVASTLRGHPDVEQAAVVPVDDPIWTVRLEGFVVPRDGASLAEDDLRDWMRERQPAYKVPRRLHVIPELPSDDSGKLSLETLRRISAEAEAPTSDR